ncbi:MAG: response regulator transcription factor [Proteobacteria bacterium]|nr:response regulator transcription factor [Pseudomonadota bacterium]
MKLLIVDDHPVVRAGLRRLLAAEPQIEIREAATGQLALGLFREFRPDLVLLDLNLPGISGLEVIGRIKAEDAKARILVLSMHDNPTYVARALQAGAKGYVSKSAPPDQILEALNRVAAGHTYIEHAIAQELALRNIQASPHPLKDLSSRDLEILRLLGEGASLPQIADAIGVSYKTVANHCSQMKAKLGAARTADLIRIAISHGISSRDTGPADTVAEPNLRS